MINKTKLKIYKTTIRPLITYAAETLTLTQLEEEKLKIFERKRIRTIMGPKKENTNNYRMLMNHEIDNILGNDNIVRVIKAQ